MEGGMIKAKMASIMCPLHNTEPRVTPLPISEGCANAEAGAVWQDLVVVFGVLHLLRLCCGAIELEKKNQPGTCVVPNYHSQGFHTAAVKNVSYPCEPSALLRYVY